VLAVAAAPLVTVLALEVDVCAEPALGPDTIPPTRLVPRIRVIAPPAPMTDPGSVAVLPVSILNTVVDEADPPKVGAVPGVELLPVVEPKVLVPGAADVLDEPGVCASAPIDVSSKHAARAMPSGLARGMASLLSRTLGRRGRAVQERAFATSGGPIALWTGRMEP
jgi:hypothetical protein